MTDDPLLGAQIAGYRIEAQVGRGGMGRVYRAIQLGLNRPVALKILSAELAQDETFRARFLKEAQLAATLEHPNILPIYEVGEDGGQLFIAMRLVEGTDLASLLRREGALTPARTLALLAQAADALDFAHAAGLVHRDVKPGNLLLAGDLLYLADFGVAKSVAARREFTSTGVFVGTLDYAAPEQIRNQPLDGGADLYSLGCVLFQCLSGRVPFDRDTQFALMQAHTAEPPPLLSTLRPDLPAALDAVIATALAKENDERFRSGRRLIEAARAAIEGRAPAVAPTRFSLLASPTLGDATPVVQPTVMSPPPATTEPSGTAATVLPHLGRVLLVRAVLAAALLVGIVVVVATMTRPPLGPTDQASPSEWASVADVAAGTNVIARLVGPLTKTNPVDITFGTVTTPGQVELTASTKGPAVPAGFTLTAGSYYDVATTAKFLGTALLCIANDMVTSTSRIYHFAGGQWNDRTASVSPPRICGNFPSFSPVVIVEPVAAVSSPSASPTSSATVSTPTRSPSTPSPTTGTTSPAPITAIVVDPPRPPTAPVISSLGCPGSVQVGQTVSCSPSISGTTPSTTYSWSASSGSTSGGSNFSTSFVSAGTFTINLQACNGPSACSNGTPQTVIVIQPAPVISSLGCPGSVQVGQTVSCSPSISGTTPSTTYSWSASSGSTSNGFNFTTSFASAGAFTINLQACNGPSACGSGMPQSVTVIQPAPVIISLGCLGSAQTGQTVSCSPSISGTTPSTTYSWSASSGSTSGGSNFSTSFVSAGTFTINLQACNGSACATLGQLVSVAAPPTPTPTLTPTPAAVLPFQPPSAAAEPAPQCGWSPRAVSVAWPREFGLVGPAQDASFPASRLPTLTWEDKGDENGDVVAFRIRFRVGLTGTEGYSPWLCGKVPMTSGLTSSWTPPAGFLPAGTYGWEVLAVSRTNTGPKIPPPQRAFSTTPG